MPDVSLGAPAAQIKAVPLTDAKLGRWLLIVALVLTCLVYLATLRFSFVYDDLPQIVGNPTLTSWRYLPTLFLSHVWKFRIPNWPGNYYRPIFMSWLLLNRMLWGLNPIPWHACALALHLATTWLAFAVSRQILRSGTQAGVVAILFGLHPIHIESVAWISGATDPLMSMFVLAALWAWIRGTDSQQHGARWKLFAGVLYLLGCLSKETAFALPILVIAYEYLFGQKRSPMCLILGAWPFWIASGIYLAGRMLALHGFEHPFGFPLSHIVMTVPAILGGYVRLLFWPVGLSAFYATPPVTSIWEWRFWLPMLTGIAALAAAWWVARCSRIFAFSFLWVFAFLAPAILGLPLFHAGEWLHDRYLYLPSFGLCLLLAHGLSFGWNSRSPFLKYVAIGLLPLIVTAMCFATAWQEQPWADSVLLFTHSARQQPDSGWAKGYLAAELYRRGDRENAARLYEEALKIDPNNWRNLADYATVLYYRGDFRRADELFTRALSLDPSDAATHLNQGICRFKYGNYAGAEDSFTAALSRDPNLPKCHYWLGTVFEMKGKIDAARAEYKEEIRLHPETAAEAGERLKQLPK